MGMVWFVLPPFAALLALGSAFGFYRWVLGHGEGTAEMRRIAAAVRKGALAYLRSQYRLVALVVVGFFGLLIVLSLLDLQRPLVPFAFVTGAFFSGFAGFLGMRTATMASARTTEACRGSLNRGLKIAFRSGAVMGLVVVGFGLLFLWAWLVLLLRVAPEGPDQLAEVTTTLLGFGMGASLQALFARVGGGIYTKAADVGADLVGKVEEGIPEDDPRNPATIADNVGDTVGDVAGMGADLYESYCGSILATAALGAVLGPAAQISGLEAVLAPLLLAALGIVVSLVGILLVRCGEESSMGALLGALDRGVRASAVLLVLGALGLVFLGVLTWGLFVSVIAGLLGGMVIGWSTGYYTSDEHRPTRGIADRARTGAATLIIEGLAVGMLSSALPVTAIVTAVLVAFGAPGGFDDPSIGLYGVGLAAVGMLSTLGITLATDAYGPIADNAGGNAEMAGLPAEVRERTDALDMLGNTTAAMGKGFAIGSAALTALALIATYLMSAEFWAQQMGRELDTGAALRLDQPLVLAGLFLGAMLAFVFCALTMKAVGRAAFAMVEEVRRQFREDPGILEGTVEPDYDRCVGISTRAAQRQMVGPALLAVGVPPAVGLILGVPGVLGLLVGGLTCGFALACLLNNAGGAWDNAKKAIEKERVTYEEETDPAHEHPLTGKSSPSHRAGVVGDTVGDPFKDTSGPSLNILLKLMSMVSIVFTPLVVKVSPLIQGWLGIH